MSARITIALTLALLALGGCDRTENAEPERPAAHASHEGHEGHAAPASAATSTEPEAERAEVEIPEARRQLTGVRTALVERRALVREIRTVGLVEADERGVRKIHTKISGWVEKLFVSFTGEFVRAGAPILSIYSPELVASQRELLLALGPAASGASDVAPEPPSPEREHLLTAARDRLLRWDVPAARVREIERTREPLRAITLQAPIGGFVTVKPVYQGMYVTPEMELYTISDLGRVWIWAQLTEDEATGVEAGEPASIEFPSQPGRTLEARVAFVSPVLDVATRTVRVRFDAPNETGALKPGMYATVKLERALGEGLALPREAVIDTGERDLVFVEVAPGHFQPRALVLGQSAGDWLEVLSGLEAGERVAVSAQFLLDSESRLRAVGAPAHSGH